MDRALKFGGQSSSSSLDRLVLPCHGKISSSRISLRRLEKDDSRDIAPGNSPILRIEILLGDEQNCFSACNMLIRTSKRDRWVICERLRQWWDILGQKSVWGIMPVRESFNIIGSRLIDLSLSL